jgi:maltooligosyltrehalose trehalohydrolase
MSELGQGYFQVELDHIEPYSRYKYRLQSEEGELERPDPASRLQPDGVHDASSVVPADYDWQDHHWHGLPLSDWIIYELHVGTFTAQGTFEAVIDQLDELKDLGITAVELMPVAQFPRTRNWGYDGVYPFAVQNSYGGPTGLKKLVNACHARGLGVILDVVYNHLGPEGNYLRDFGPYFTDFYNTPWGQAINFDGPLNEGVRRFFIENALYWITQFHIDGLRLDAVHAIVDFSAKTFLEELGSAVRLTAEQLNRHIYCIAESDLNDTRIIRPVQNGGYHLDSVWNDDFHHALHALLTGEEQGYYQDFGRLEDLARALSNGYVYSGQYSRYRRKRHGNYSGDLPAQKFVVFAQNHDQIGNRMLGERLIQLAGFEKAKLAAAMVLLSPYVPLLFMGEEYGESAPFTYFVSHTDPELVEAVRSGRRMEFAAFGWKQEPPDPQDEATFQQSKLNRGLSNEGRHSVLRAYYRELIGLRKSIQALRRPDRASMHVMTDQAGRMLGVHRLSHVDEALLIVHAGDGQGHCCFPLTEGIWEKKLDSQQQIWQGSGSPIPDRIECTGKIDLFAAPWSVALFVREKGPLERLIS